MIKPNLRTEYCFSSPSTVMPLQKNILYYLQTPLKDYLFYLILLLQGPLYIIFYMAKIHIMYVFSSEFLYVYICHTLKCHIPSNTFV
jgi:hypothetical protein